MTYNEITAIVDLLAIKRVRQSLRAINIPGITVFRVKGYGKHKNFFRRGLMQQHSCLSVIASEQQTDHIVQTILDAAHTGLEGDGIVSVKPLSRFYSIYDKKQIQ
ncbi:hypothetical protein MNBD_ALPHA06-1897 [hydrothermal vent metagenome]|uniref:Nitrogen regulatory protein P-II n=1 Tax=hydrothermal vent metagenome TaxID=652676 RepID=A0A3B0SCJ5_9ZZZZ